MKKLYLSSLVEKVLAVIIAILLPLAPITQATPAKKQNKENTQEIVQKAEQEEAVEFVANEEYAPQNETAVPEIAQPEEPADVVEENSAEEGADLDKQDAETVRGKAYAEQKNAPVAEWNVSATEEDEVDMSFYPEKATLLEKVANNVTGAIGRLFGPMTVYAAEEREQIRGTVTLTGEGDPQAMLFPRFLYAEDFLEYYEDWCDRKGYDSDVRYIRYEGIDIITGVFHSNLVSYEDALQDALAIAEQKGETVTNVYDNLIDKYFPAYMYEIVLDTENFWETFGHYIPIEVVITGKVTNINCGAFAFCNTIERITIDANIISIEAGAFGMTNIKTVELPSTVKRIGADAFYNCRNLKNIIINGYIPVIGDEAFDQIAYNSKIICKDRAMFLKLQGIDPETEPQVADDQEEEVQPFALNERTTVELNVG